MEAFVIIDMQIGYFKTPALITQQKMLVDEINKLTDTFSDKKRPVFNIKTAHSRDRSSWTLNMLADEKGFMLNGSKESENIQGLRTDTAIEVIKTRDSAFTATNLKELLDMYEVKHITLAGILAHSCVFMTAADAYALNFSVSLAKNTIADEGEDLQQEAFDYLIREYRQEVL